jgi:lathosterol oxidase
MDLVLELCDTYALDRVYATLLPAKPSEVAAASINATIPYLTTESAFKGAWANLVSFLPHSSAPEIIASPIAKNVTANLSPLSSWPRDYIPRQIISLFVITIIGIHILYYLFAGFSYYFVFNHEMMRHPRFLKNQVRKEIIQSESSFPGMILLTLPWFFGEVRGWSKVYGGLGEVGEYGWGYLVFSAFWCVAVPRTLYRQTDLQPFHPRFLFVTDFGVYCIHRGLHHPAIYKYIHKPHHKWLIPTPFASHAFHPMDGYAQSLPYHIYVYVFPIHRILFLALFVFVNCWSILVGFLSIIYPL